MYTPPTGGAGVARALAMPAAGCAGDGVDEGPTAAGAGLVAAVEASPTCCGIGPREHPTSNTTTRASFFTRRWCAYLPDSSRSLAATPTNPPAAMLEPAAMPTQNENRGAGESSPLRVFPPRS